MHHCFMTNWHAGTVPLDKLAAVHKALVADIASRGNHLTVGATGQKWLLRVLSGAGAAEHEVALAVASQTTFPSWGYWIGQGATTCWESWTGVQDGSHPGNGNNAINPPTHNHIFLCGGVGEWMYRSLGGIAPATPGYGVVTIAPQVSQTEGPSAVNASVSTIRGVVESRWIRHPHSLCRLSAEQRGALVGTVFELHVHVPVGSRAKVTVPLLHSDPASATLLETDALLWSGSFWSWSLWSFGSWFFKRCSAVKIS